MNARPLFWSLPGEIDIGDPQDISPDSVSLCLGRILATKPFQASDQMSAFMTFVVGKTLAGEADEIKSYTVAVDGLGKPTSFDPQADPTVRVLAGRVRRALKVYYLESGASDEVRIKLKPGSYVPEFVPVPGPDGADTGTPGTNNADAQGLAQRKARVGKRSINPPESPTNSGTDTSSGGFTYGNPLSLGVIGLVLAVFALAGFALGLNWSTPPPEIGSSKNTTQNLLPKLGVSVLYSGHGPDWFSVSELSASLAVVLSRFDDLELMGVTEAPQPVDLATAPGDYHLVVNAEQRGEAMRFFGRLVRIRDQATIWSREQLLSAPGEMENRSVPDLLGAELASVASPYGIIPADLARRDDLPDNLHCLARAYQYFAARSAPGHAAAFTCARDLVDAGSKSPLVNALLTFLVLDIHRYEYPGLDDPLPAAHRYALQAIKISPGSARAQQAIFAYYKVAGDHANAQVSGARAVTLNPYDIDILGDYGAYLVSRGEFEKALPIMLKAEKLALATPEWFNAYLYLNAHYVDRPDIRSRAIGRLRDHTSTMALVALAIDAKISGDNERAAKIIEVLLATESGFETDPVERLRRRGFSEGATELVMADLRDAGLRMQSAPPRQ